MSGPERQAPDDKLLEDFLDGRSPASRAWREAMRGESAPPEMEGAVLDMARREIEEAAARPPSRDRFRDRRWPFALAAVLVLSFSTLLTIVQDPAAHKDAMMAAPDAAPAAAVVLPEAAAPVAVEAPPQPAPVREAAPAPKPQAFPARPSSPASAMSAGSADALRDRAAADAPSGPEAAAMAMPAPPPAAPSATEESRQAEPDELKAARRTPEMLQQRAAPPAFAGAAKLEREEAESEAAAATGLERIRRLLAEGHEEQARQALAAWRRQWPERPVPEDLKRLAD